MNPLSEQDEMRLRELESHRLVEEYEQTREDIETQLERLDAIVDELTRRNEREARMDVDVIDSDGEFHEFSNVVDVHESQNGAEIVSVGGETDRRETVPLGQDGRIVVARLPASAKTGEGRR